MNPDLTDGALNLVYARAQPMPELTNAIQERGHQPPTPKHPETTPKHPEPTLYGRGRDHAETRNQD